MSDSSRARKIGRTETCEACGHGVGKASGSSGHRCPVVSDERLVEVEVKVSGPPTQILPGFLYLGDYNDASCAFLLKNQRISRILNRTVKGKGFVCSYIAGLDQTCDGRKYLIRYQKIIDASNNIFPPTAAPTSSLLNVKGIPAPTCSTGTGTSNQANPDAVEKLPDEILPDGSFSDLSLLLNYYQGSK